MKTIYVILIGLFIELSVNLVAQDATVDFVKINQAFEQIQQFSATIEYSTYQDDKLESNYSVYLMKDSILTYHMIDSVETISNIDYNILVNHKQKTIFIAKKSINAPPKTLNPVEISALLKKCEKVNYEKLKNGLAVYTLLFNNGQYEEAKFWFDTKSYLLNKIELFYLSQQSTKNQVRFVVAFKNMNIKPVFSENQFSYKKFLEIKENKFEPKVSYSEYVVTDMYTNIEAY